MVTSRMSHGLVYHGDSMTEILLKSFTLSKDKSFHAFFNEFKIKQILKQN